VDGELQNRTAKSRCATFLASFARVGILTYDQLLLFDSQSQIEIEKVKMPHLPISWLTAPCFHLYRNYLLRLVERKN
jgi:hypothetical protein